MRYTKGKPGPVSINQIELTAVTHCGEGNSAYAKGEAMLKKAKGDLTKVTFMVQGANYRFHLERLVVGNTMRVPVRWTGGSAVTIVDGTTLDKFRAEQEESRKAA